MINQVHIQNYKCLRDVTVDLKPLTVLIGPNDSGKTSFLEAVQLPFFQGVRIDSSAKWECSDELTVNVVAVSESGKISKYPNQRGTFQFSAPSGERDAEFDSRISYFVLSPDSLRLPSDGIESPALSRTGDNLASVLHTLRAGPETDLIVSFEKQLHTAIPTLLGFSTPPSPGSTQNNHKREVQFTLSTSHGRRVSIPAGRASDGAILLVAFLAIAFTETANVILIEEPENGLHPGRLEMVIDLLRKMTTGEIGNKPRQVILTTHSPLLLNYVDPAEVRVFRRNENGETTVTPMNEVPEIDRLMKTFSPGEIWNLFGEEKMFEGVPV